MVDSSPTDPTLSSSDAVPGWGAGQEAGGPATRQVFVWDRDEPDPFSAVHLLSVRTDGQPTVVGASDPAISRDGRVVAFTSADVGLGSCRVPDLRRWMPDPGVPRRS